MWLWFSGYLVMPFKVLSYVRQGTKESKGKRSGYLEYVKESTAWSLFIKSTQNESQHCYHFKMIDIG